MAGKAGRALQRAVGNLKERQQEGEKRAASNLRGLLQQAQVELKNQGHDLQREREEGKIARNHALDAEQASKHRIELQCSEISKLTAKVQELGAEKFAVEEKLRVDAGKRNKEVDNLREQLSLYETEILEIEKKQRESTMDKAKLQEELEQARRKWEAEMIEATIGAEKIVDEVKRKCATDMERANEEAGKRQSEVEELKNGLEMLGAKMKEDASRHQAEV